MEQIGIATMLEDGTLILTLKAEGPDGTMGDAQLFYTPSDPRYDEVLQHIGPVAPGQTVPVPPWPEPGVPDDTDERTTSPMVGTPIRDRHGGLVARPPEVRKRREVPPRGPGQPRRRSHTDHLGAPARVQPGWLDWLDSTSGEFGRLFLPGAGTRCVEIGAADAADITLREEWISPAHLHVEADAAGSWWAVDLGSPAGVWVDGRRIDRRELDAEVMLFLGKTLVLFNSQPPPPDVLSLLISSLPRSYDARLRASQVCVRGGAELSKHLGDAATADVFNEAVTYWLDSALPGAWSWKPLTPACWLVVTTGGQPLPDSEIAFRTSLSRALDRFSAAESLAVADPVWAEVRNVEIRFDGRDDRPPWSQLRHWVEQHEPWDLPPMTPIFSP